MGNTKKMHASEFVDRRFKPPRTDIIGKTFGTLQVIGVSDEKICGARAYKCRCTVCGAEVNSRAYALEHGYKKSCGGKHCLNVLHNTAKNDNYKYRGFTDCTCYASEFACSGLTEMLCRTRGKCKFYKSAFEE